MSNDLFTSNFKAEPYWWEAAPRPDLGTPELPAKADVVIVGSGYTGLCAAIQTARGGRSTVVIDADDAGYGCSSRNGGQIGWSIKPSYKELTARHGSEKALAILREGDNALEWIGDFVKSEEIECSFNIGGRFHAAHSPSHYEELARAVANQPPGIDHEGHMVPKAEMQSELGTKAYHGGAVYPAHASLDPRPLPPGPARPRHQRRRHRGATLQGDRHRALRRLRHGHHNPRPDSRPATSLSPPTAIPARLRPGSAAG